jgi:hypothetical protein
MLAAYQNAALSLYVNEPKSFPRSFEEWIDKEKIEKERLAKVQTNEEFGAALLKWARINGMEEVPENGT